MSQRGNCSTEKFDPATFKLRALVYGGPGTGKTRFSCDFPKPYVYDTDRGLLSVVGQDVEYFQPDTWRDFSSDLAQVVVKAQSGEWDRETIVLDSASSFYDLIMGDVLRYQWIGTGEGKGKRFEVTSTLREMREESDYGLSHNRLTQVLMTVKRLPVHLVVTCHEQIDIIDEFGVKKPKGTLELPGKLPYRLPALFDTVLRTRTFDGQDTHGKPTRRYALQTATDGNYMAKIRVPPGRLLDLFEEPTFENLWRKLVIGEPSP